MAHLGQLIRSVSLQLTAKQKNRYLLSLIKDENEKQEHETAWSEMTIKMTEKKHQTINE